MCRSKIGVLLLCLLSFAIPTVSVARWITLESYRFDPTLGEPIIPEELSVDAAAPGYGYYLVQLRGPVTEDQREELAGAGVAIHGYLSDGAFLIGCDASLVEEVRRLPSVVWMGPFHPAFKISPELEPDSSPAAPGAPDAPGVPDGRRDLIVVVFRDLEGVVSAIGRLGGVILERSESRFLPRLVVRIDPAQVRSIARIRDVWWIEPRGEIVPMNNTTRWVVQSNVEGVTPLWDHGLFGQGMIATIMDSGIDYNSCWFRDPEGMEPGPAHRKVVDLSLWGGEAGEGCSRGHGTFVAGVMLGDQSPLSDGSIDHNGIAYRARITVQDIVQEPEPCVDGQWQIPASLTAALDASIGLGARVHSDSWGSYTTAYTVLSSDVDRATWMNPDFLSCFAIGNAGPSNYTMASPATAKNCITVGACRQAPDQEYAADYSSRGPTQDGRIKPTLLTPSGQDPVYITSADNSMEYPPSPSCQSEGEGWGTSYAAPVAAGLALLAREYYLDGYYPLGDSGGTSLTPSAALVKATLIAGTRDMSGVTAGIPNWTEGWGRVLADDALYFPGDRRELLAEDHRSGLATGQSWSRTFTIDDPGEPLVVSLVWSDYPATPGAGLKLVNDLNLTVVAPSGETYLGNVLANGWSTTGGYADIRNVEEGVRIQTPSAGLWTVRVSALNVPAGAQPFALVMAGGFASWPEPLEDVGGEGSEPVGQVAVRSLPNPTGLHTSIEYVVPDGYCGKVRLSLADAQGRIVQTLVDKGQRGGRYRISWDGRNSAGQRVAAGVYFARLEVGGATAVGKIVRN